MWKQLLSRCLNLPCPILLGAKSHSKPNCWPVTLKLMLSKRVSCEDNVAETNEFEIVDAALCSLIGHKTRQSSSISADNALSVLGNLELSIQDHEGGDFEDTEEGSWMRRMNI
ncbi:hypothetical protein JRO89_XS02G0008300 [Xanthoceras sorbifolium]|uniref:Uncharacterized protein n=1 Tax=Xanthoceras sorbifolium TaxID=99658 RepID=A0ABQ8IDN7_9ROSI|nr:hypothetical protein JRO89_XS02G0008300 [Xanthoceras sorbifolium]